MIRGFIPFPKVNVIVRLEFELAHYDSAVQHFNHYPTRTPSISERHTSNDEYEIFVTAHIETAAEFITNKCKVPKETIAEKNEITRKKHFLKKCQCTETLESLTNAYKKRTSVK